VGQTRAPQAARNENAAGADRNTTARVSVAPSGLARFLGIDPGAACSLRFALAPGYPLTAPAALLRFALSYLLPPWAVLRFALATCCRFQPSISVPHRAFGVGQQERRRRGQKVARGKRAARSPRIASNKKSGPEGPQKTLRFTCLSPLRGSLAWGD
jgi:hypothetical protein